MNRRRLKFGCALLTTLAVALLALLVVTASHYRVPAGKYDPANLAVTPADVPSELTTRLQLVDYTCGLRALEAVYIAYGIDPEAADIRFRLGVDRPAIPFDAGSRGTLHPDLLRVLGQDSFATTIIDCDREDFVQRIMTHLETGHPLLALIRQEASGGLHWVVLSDVASGQVTVVDSLEETPVRRPAEWCEQACLSVIGVTPEGDGVAIDVTTEHARGIAEMRRVLGRIRD